MQDFQKAKKQLNKQQLDAVEAIEGPVMVLAGPGTGKTQTVALRIAEILGRTQIGAKNILALTFTEAGVTALRNRLESFIGPEAYQVTICTFHSFGAEIIATFPYIFNFDENAAQIAELDRYLLLEKIVLRLSNLPLLKPVKMPTAHIKPIADAIRVCKQEAVSPDMLRELSCKEISDIEAAEKLTKAEREKRLSLANKNLEISDIYAEYQQELVKQGRYDYEDMILLVVGALQDNEELRLYYQEKYQYILVDEYQDTNSSQNALVETLASFFVNPNLFVVGDDKQAIYRFQGASVANMLHFAKKYPAMKIVSLQENYRSCPEILAAAQALIVHNTHQLSTFLEDIDQTLLPACPPLAKPELVTLPTKLSQYEWIIAEIQKISAKKGITNNIAVLVRTNNEVREFRDIAEKSSLLVSGALTSDLITEPEIQLLITMLRAIDNPKYDLFAMSALRSLVTGPSLLKLLEARSVREKGQSLLHTLINSDDAQLVLYAQKILDLHQLADKCSLTELLEQLVEETTILEQVRKRPDTLEGLELLAAFFNEAKRFGQRRPSSQLGDFLEYLDLLRRYTIHIPVNRALPETGGVFVSTVHGAKGLEFDAVFMANVDENAWKTKANRTLIKLPSTIVDLTNWSADAEEDDRRLFYVGITRAKTQLYLTMSAHADDGKELLPCQFVAEIADTVAQVLPKVLEKELSSQYEKYFRPVPSQVLAKRELAFVREKIKATPLSYTSYHTYLVCPKQFLLRYVFGLPTETTIPLIYGVSIHKALEQFFRQFKARKELPTKEELLSGYKAALDAQPAIEQKDGILRRGLEVLGAYYDKNKTVWGLPEGIEYSMSKHQVMLGEVPLTGKFDRLDVLDSKTKAVRIVDYKTVSTVPSRNDILGNTKTSDGHLKLQLAFYSLLAETDRLFPYQAKEFVLSFIDDKLSFKEESFTVSKEERQELAAQIKLAYTEMLERTDFTHIRDEFDSGCEVCASFPSL